MSNIAFEFRARAQGMPVRVLNFSDWRALPSVDENKTKEKEGLKTRNVNTRVLLGYDFPFSCRRSDLKIKNHTRIISDATMEPLHIFENFKLDDLDENWVESVWDGEFLTFKNPPDSYIEYINTEDMNILLKDSASVVREWISSAENDKEPTNSSRSEVSWQTLISLNVNPRSLLPVLGYMINAGQSLSADEDARQFCLKSSSLYFALLSVPGSNAFHVFHPNLYHLAFNTFKLSERLVPKSRRRTVADEDLADLYQEEDRGGLIHTEKITLTEGLNSLMYSLTKMMREFGLRDHPRSLEITVHLLLLVAKLAREVIHFGSNELRRTEASVSSLSYNAYAALHLLCNADHGSVDVTVRLIAKYLLPNLVSNPDDLATKDLGAIRETMTNYLQKLLETHSEEAHQAVATLIQHMMVKCPERVDARLKQAAVILRLFNSCEKDAQAMIVEDLVSLAHNNKINLRIFAQEIIGRMFSENYADSVNLQMKKSLLATVLSRCVDSSSLVRGKAMSIIAECTEPQNVVASALIKDIFEGSDPDKPLPGVEALREAISEDVDPLPGSNTIVSILVARVDDERAFVRRSALQTLGNVVHLFSGLLNTLTPVLGLHCRDPAMIVRRYSVQVFSQLVEKFPEHPLLPQEWVKNVLPQIFDMEVKVQEKVLESMQQLILDKISRFVENNNNDHFADLPWAILNQITEQKMRKHLTKGCALWVKTDVATDSLIGDIKTHLGTANNIPAWVLLSAIAKYKDLPGMNEHFENYKDILCQNTFEANLVIEVLRNSWSSLDRSFLRTLHADLFESLSKFQVNFTLVSICCDLFVELAKHLHPDNGDEIVKINATDLMKLSEAQLEKFFDHEEAGEESLQIYLKAMCTLGNASHLCTASISPSTLCTLQGLVVEWDSLPETIRYLSELRASAIVVLGQQAMRDREDAQKILPVLGHLIRTSTAPNSRVEAAVKVNAAKALADICIRFTALVEPHLPDMCVSMKDPDPTIREAIVVLFIQLLLEDFIKVKGPFFFHILTMLTDTDEMVRDLTVFLINERLLAKNKTLIFRQFIESIFHYNNYKLTSKFSNLNEPSQREITALTFPGRRNRAQRNVIYNFMIEHLEPMEKLKIVRRLTSEILSGAICGTVDVQKDNGISVINDVLYILSREEMQATSTVKRTDDDYLENQNEPEENLPANTVANAIASEIKKHRIEILIPTLINLKKILVKISSPFAEYVIKYYLKIVKEYKKDQLLTIFSEDRNLEKEIEKDLK